MERDRSLDGLKFILIFLVVIMHMNYSQPFGINVNRIIHTFLMPMFILLSGYFTKVTTWEHYFRWARKIVGIFLIFTALHSLTSVWLYEKTFMEAFLNGLVEPFLAMWYLVSLFTWRTFLQILPTSVVQSGWKIIMGGVIVALLAGFVPLGHEFSFQRTMAWLPFFLLGFQFRQWNAIVWIREQKSWPFIVASLICCVLALYLPRNMPREAYVGIGDMLMRGKLLINSFVLSICILRLIPPVWAGRMGWLGGLTMYFYLYHTLINRTQMFYFEQHGIKVNILEAMLIGVAYIIVILLMSRLKPFRWLMLQK